MDDRGQQLVARLIDDCGVAQVEVGKDRSVRGVVVHARDRRGRDARFAVQVAAGDIEVHIGLYSRYSAYGIIEIMQVKLLAVVSF